MRYLTFLCLTACAAAPLPLRCPVLSWQVRLEADPASLRTTTDSGVLMQAELHLTRTPVAGLPIETTVQAIAAAGGMPFRGAAPLSGIVALPDAAAADWGATAAAAAIEELRVGTSPAFTVLRGASTRLSTNLPDVPTLLLLQNEDRTVMTQFLIAQDALLPLRVVIGDHPARTRGWFIPSADGAGAGYVLLLHRIDEANAAERKAADAAAHTEVATIPERPLLTELRGLVASSIGAQNRRGALLALASRTREATLVDIVLTADEATLIELSQTITATAPAAGSDYAWQFAQAVMATLVPRMQRDDLSLGLSACLLRHFGTLSSDPSGLGQLLASSGDFTTFWEGVLRENLQALGDHRVGVRVRAHDWLAARDAAVPDFDPLGPSTARRDALRARAQRATPTGQTAEERR